MPDESQHMSQRAHVARPHPARARQFLPFAALTGYYDLVRERGLEIAESVDAAEHGFAFDEDPSEKGDSSR